MITEKDVLTIIDAYAAATGASDTTISSRVFADSKKLDALRNGATITLRRANETLQWLTANWPDGGEWPADIPRPEENPQALAPAAQIVVGMKGAEQ